LATGIKLEIEQEGKRSPMRIKENPKESWGTASAPLLNSNFSICVTDSSNTTWLAVGTPTVISRLDQLTNKLLIHYYLILLFGLVIVVVLLLRNGFKQEESTMLSEV
jgi:hypothetical protein